MAISWPASLPMAWPSSRIDRQDADGLPLRAQVGDEAVDQRTLSRARVSGDADDLRPSGPGPELAQDRFGFRPRVVDQPDQPRRRTDVSGEDAVGDSSHALSSSRAITTRWISLVPSPMVQSLTSR